MPKLVAQKGGIYFIEICVIHHKNGSGQCYNTSAISYFVIIQYFILKIFSLIYNSHLSSRIVLNHDQFVSIIIIIIILWLNALRILMLNSHALFDYTIHFPRNSEIC